MTTETRAAGEGLTAKIAEWEHLAEMNGRAARWATEQRMREALREACAALRSEAGSRHYWHQMFLSESEKREQAEARLQLAETLARAVEWDEMPCETCDLDDPGGTCSCTEPKRAPAALKAWRQAKEGGG